MLSIFGSIVLSLFSFVYISNRSWSFFSSEKYVIDTEDKIYKISNYLSSKLLKHSKVYLPITNFQCFYIQEGCKFSQRLLITCRFISSTLYIIRKALRILQKPKPKALQNPNAYLPYLPPTSSSSLPFILSTWQDTAVAME